jgi:hypothetical protein
MSAFPMHCGELTPFFFFPCSLNNLWLLAALVFIVGGFSLVNKFGKFRTIAVVLTLYFLSLATPFSPNELPPPLCPAIADVILFTRCGPSPVW